ncbi:polysaccharide biosynthesis tyrosine autokinase [Microbacterium terricola]|uniref:Chromosome partitioning protein n=1 Tax=Microbacterium terricola TaxID=344163 RepID=A0ABM8DVZ5_9MICO|nr:polysaccharide biosynthesis tyrosine autokinase [Microbacterium terricola]UYK39508.1 polysaccharide biosynthesis tyrosine autokinase [Microbacterium terricola]BDV29759.1 chromosome partitioning protein [Microbacterium terricola]
MELRDYLRILRAHWLGIVLLTVLGAAIAYGWSSLQPRVYTASASGYVASTTAGTDTGSSLVGDQLARAKVTSYVDIGSWRSVAEYAIDDLGLDTTPEALVTRVDVSNPLDTVIIQVKASAGSPEEARDLAESWTRGMLAEIDQIEGDGSAGSAAITLIPGDSARLPSSPSSPNTRLDIALGALIGLALGIGYAVIRHVLDRRVRNPRDIERETGTAVVGSLPLEKELSQERRLLTFDGPAQNQNSSAGTEALRELRTNLQFMDVDNPPRIIVVSSPLPGDGKSTTSANLALSLAAAGQRVVLVDADLRRPVVSSLFGLPEGAGLTDVLAGRAKLADVLQPVGATGNLSVLSAGRIPPNPSEVLGSQRMRELLRTFGAGATVIIDSPPTIPVTDAAVLSTSADGVLLVVSAGRTTYEMLQKALDNIAKANGRVLGVVLNKVPKRGAGAAYYGYQYNGRYYSDRQPLTRRAWRKEQEREQEREQQGQQQRETAGSAPGGR